MTEPQMNYFLTRLLAFLQCIIGFLLLTFGIVERVIVELWSSQIVIPIWIGVWILAGGCIGIAASSRSRPVPMQSLVGTFMAFSIVSAVLAAVIIICYSLILGVEIPATNPCTRIYYSYHPYSAKYCPSSRTKNIAISVMVLLFGIAEFPIAIWSAVLQCKACACCYGNSENNTARSNQVFYMTNMAGRTHGHVVAQPMAIAGQECTQPASTGQAPMYFSSQGASPAASQPVVMVQGQPMVPFNQPTSQPMVQGQPFVAVNQPHGQPVVQGQPMMTVSQQPGQYMVQGQRIMALNQPSGLPMVQGQYMVAISQPSGQPMVQGQPMVVASLPSGQSMVQGQPMMIASQTSGQPMVQGQPGQPVVQGQPVVVASQPSGQPMVQGQPMVVASQPSGQPMVQGQQVLLVNEPFDQSISQEQSVAPVNQPPSQPALQEQQMLSNQSPEQPVAITTFTVQSDPVGSSEVSQLVSDSKTENA